MSAVSIFQTPVPVRGVDRHFGGLALVALVIDDLDAIRGVVIDEDGRFHTPPLFDLKVVPRPGDDIRMAVGWATDVDDWRALAAVRRDGYR